MRPRPVRMIQLICRSLVVIDHNRIRLSSLHRIHGERQVLACENIHRCCDIRCLYGLFGHTGAHAPYSQHKDENSQKPEKSLDITLHRNPLSVFRVLLFLLYNICI